MLVSVSTLPSSAHLTGTFGCLLRVELSSRPPEVASISLISSQRHAAPPAFPAQLLSPVANGEKARGASYRLRTRLPLRERLAAPTQSQVQINLYNLLTLELG